MNPICIVFAYYQTTLPGTLNLMLDALEAALVTEHVYDVLLRPDCLYEAV
jgi:hypothetical protein